MEQLRERLLEYGSQTLLTEELLALILRTGATHEKGHEWARLLLSKYGGLGGLLHIECSELTQLHGLSETRIALLKAVLELGKRLNSLQPEEKYQIKTPADAANLVMLDMAYLNFEQLRVIVLDTRNQVIDNIPLYQGTVNSSVLRAAEIFRLAVVRNCPAIIICHNQANVPFRGKLRFACMQPHAYTHGPSTRPSMAGHGMLHLHCCTNGIGGTSEGHEEGISLRVDLVAATRLERGTQ